MSDDALDLRRFEVLMCAEEAGQADSLAEAAAWPGRVLACDSHTQARADLDGREVAAIVAQADSAEAVLELLTRLGEITPSSCRIAVAPAEEGLPLLAAVNRGLLEQWVPRPVVGAALTDAIRTALVRHAAVSSTRDLVDLLRSRLEVTQRRTELLKEERGDLRSRLARLSATDRVTGLYNRRHLVDHWRREVARARRYGLHLSLVLFAARSHGEIDDDGLRQVGSFLVRAIRDVDMVGRAGPDRFALILPHCDRKDATLLAARIIDDFAEGEELEAARSGGPWKAPAPGDEPSEARPDLFATVASLGPDGDAPDAVLEAAEAALVAKLKD
jgi:GGDEF domain-containing protein